MINGYSLNTIVNLFIMDHLVTSVGLQMFLYALHDELWQESIINPKDITVH